MRRLPSLNGIRAFEAAARNGGFAGAARELNVTPAAISRMVQLLEERLGIALFERRANRLQLTSSGRLYQAGLTPLLDAMAQLTADVTGRGEGHIVTVGVGPTFAIRWLIPRLSLLQREAPGLEVRITTGGAAAPFAGSWSCGIQLGDARMPGLCAEPLFAADLIPVCAPAMAAALRAPEDLDPARLIRVAHAPEDWPRWLGEACLPRLRPAGPVFELYGQALQAAVDGIGVALGLRPYIDDDLRAGRLVAPFSLAVPKGRPWHLIYQESRRGEPGFAAFRSWILRMAKGELRDG
ncbi:LysR family transcriptional regulator [Roseomonas sp. SSH11]|uniref:LysR family transcriptional regulator n=1 Tax=Pararoseomonas baculiformis TaxID=2820812 RepID=A0ABS4AAT0_9PROT|nr:LysR substrate-binding domain-containing protein [Pararoseomonas baculiformis]MBP0444110.1 LysR family transcriptional regulator [Pararoseomonas baculiformis]